MPNTKMPTAATQLPATRNARPGRLQAQQGIGDDQAVARRQQRGGDQTEDKYRRRQIRRERRAVGITMRHAEPQRQRV